MSLFTQGPRGYLGGDNVQHTNLNSQKGMSQDSESNGMF
jgi:hypothetical protein